jgi:hypothetical protein
LARVRPHQFLKAPATAGKLQCSNIGTQPEQPGANGQSIHVEAPSFLKQELAHFSNDQRFIDYEHVVAGVMQFDDSRVLHAGAEVLDCTFYPLRERLDVAIEFIELYEAKSCLVG